MAPEYRPSVQLAQGVDGSESWSVRPASHGTHCIVAGTPGSHAVGAVYMQLVRLDADADPETVQETSYDPWRLLVWPLIMKYTRVTVPKSFVHDTRPVSVVACIIQHVSEHV